MLGVVIRNPDTVTLPPDFLGPQPDVLCVGPYSRYVFGQQVRASCLLNWLLACLVPGLVCGRWVDGWDVRTAVVGWLFPFFFFFFFFCFHVIIILLFTLTKIPQRQNIAHYT